MTPCLKCGEPARWRDDRGRAWCSSHLPNSGQFRRLRQEVAEVVKPLDTDILELLENATEGECCLFEPAAAEIRRLRALVGVTNG